MDLHHRRHTFGVVNSYPLRSYPAIRENDLTRIRSGSLFTGPLTTTGVSPICVNQTYTVLPTKSTVFRKRFVETHETQLCSEASQWYLSGPEFES